MEGLAGFGFIIILWLLAFFVFFLMILSIAIDCSRSARRADKIIDLLQTQNSLLAGGSRPVAVAPSPAPSAPRPSASDLTVLKL